MLGYVFFSEKKYDKAIEHFAQALENMEKKNPGSVNPTLCYNYAIARQMAGQIDEAAALLNKAMEKPRISRRLPSVCIPPAGRRRRPAVHRGAGGDGPHAAGRPKRLRLYRDPEQLPENLQGRHRGV